MLTLIRRPLPLPASSLHGQTMLDIFWLLDICYPPSAQSSWRFCLHSFPESPFSSDELFISLFQPTAVRRLGFSFHSEALCLRVYFIFLIMCVCGSYWTYMPVEARGARAPGMAAIRCWLTSKGTETQTQVFSNSSGNSEPRCCLSGTDNEANSCIRVMNDCNLLQAGDFLSFPGASPASFIASQKLRLSLYKPADGQTEKSLHYV